MKNSHVYSPKGMKSRVLKYAEMGALTWLLVALLTACLGLPTQASAQVVESADAGGLRMSAGVTVSGYYVGYGERKLLGYTGFVDIGPRGFLGIEAEARQLVFNQLADVHVATYLAGPRYPFREVGRFQPYAKALIGVGEFNFTYNYAHGSYLVIAPGGGVDYRLNGRMRLRLADFEYQSWPQFTFGAIPSYGVSTGVKFLIF